MTSRRAVKTLDLLAKLRTQSALFTKKEYDRLIMDAGMLINSQTALKVLNQMKQHMNPTNETYNRILSVMSKEGRHRNVVSMLQEMNAKHYVDAKSYEIVLVSCGKQGDIARTRLLLHSMRRKKLERTSMAYSGAIQSCAKSGNITQAKSFWREMEDEQILPNRECVHNMMQVYHRSRRDDIVQPMKDLFNNAVQIYDIKPNREMGILLLHSLAPAEVLEWIVSLQQQNIGLTLDGEIYRASMLKLDRHGDVDAVVEVLNLYLHARSSISPHHVIPFLGNLNLSPASIQKIVPHLEDFFSMDKSDIKLCNTLLNLLALNGLDDDFEIYLDAIVRRKQADPHTYRIALTYCNQLNEADEKRRQFLAWLEAADPPKATITTYNGALHYAIQANRMDVAEDFFEYMPILPDAASYGILIKGYANQPPSPIHKTRAIELLKEMLNENLRPTTSGLVCVVKSLRGSPDEVLPFMRQLLRMPNVHVTIDVVHGALEILRSRGMWRQALELCNYTKLSGLQLTHETHTMMLLTCANGYEFDHAMRILHDQYSEVMKPSLDVFNAAIEVCAKTKRVDEALAMFAGIRENGLVPNDKTYARLVNVLVHTRNIELARDYLIQMQQDGIPLTLQMYHRLLRGCCIMGSLDLAYELLDELKDNLIHPNVLTFSHILHTMLDSNSHGVDAMENIVRDLQSHGLKPSVEVYTMMIQKCIRQNAGKHALQIFERMVDDEVWPDKICFDIYVKAWGRLLRKKSNEVVDTIEDLPDIQILTKHLQDPRWSSRIDDPNTYVEVFKLFQVLGEVWGIDHSKEAHDLLRAMESTNELYSAEANAIVMNLYNREEEYEEAEFLFNTLSDRKIMPNSSCFVEYMVAMEANERWIESTSAFVAMQKQLNFIPLEKLRRTYIGRYYLRTKSLPTAESIENKTQ